eukprot:TRINITY_DN66067_c2_g1_i3.p1 TRINITY_DN66067_c2_g1~~TRINITY_DN66067_c2_g1_i3.p1  ORF type:complete len:453 (+),score=68.32 TRINITY_DN66067_c2_g1_i3:43-1401(+)
MRTVAAILLLSIVIGCQGNDCTIQNSEGKKTNLAGVKDFIWSGPDKPSGVTNYNWSLSLCHPVRGVCQPGYAAYLQQGGEAGGCPGNAYFKTFNSGTGGQGGSIYMTYQGNPTTHAPIMGRVAHVVVKCDPSGTYSRISNCEVDVEGTGSNYVYTVQCDGKIACSGAPAPGPSPAPIPTPPPVPSPPPPPSDHCTIQNSEGQKTNIAGVKDHIWWGPDKPSGTTNYNWSLSLCHRAQGVCAPQYSAYLQQGGPGGCPGNAYFATLKDGTGGQGGSIYMTYQGNPTRHAPVMSRVGHVVIKCDPSGTYDSISNCQVDVEGTGSSYVYTVQCDGKIACSGAPAPGPSPSPIPPPVPSPPGPSPPPAGCTCDFGLWEGNKHCMGKSGGECRAYGARCTHFTDSMGNKFSVATGSRCKDYNLYKGGDCVNGYLGSFAVNNCSTTYTGASVLMFCPP